MSSVTRTAGVAGTFTYTTSQVPYSAPVLTIYSDAARTVTAVGANPLTATATSNVFTAAYPATLAAGTYYLSFSTVYTNGQPAVVDTDDILILTAAGGVVDAASTTALDWVEEVKRIVYAGQRPVLNKASANVASGAGTSTITFAYDLTGVSRGSVLSCGLETMYVWAADTTSKTVTVERGYNGSIIGAHTTTDLFTVNPRITDHDIFRSLNHELNVLAKQGIYQLKTLDRTFSPPLTGYDLASDLLDDDVVEASWRDTGPTLDYAKVREYRVLRNLPTTDFPSGAALFVHEDVQQGRPLRITYKAGLGQLSALTDVVTSTTGLPVSAVDIPPLGAAIRLMAAKPLRRSATDVQGDTRRPTEASTSDTLSAPNGLRALYQKRVSEEAARLVGQNPYKVRR